MGSGRMRQTNLGDGRLATLINPPSYASRCVPGTTGVYEQAPCRSTHLDLDLDHSYVVFAPQKNDLIDIASFRRK